MVAVGLGLLDLGRREGAVGAGRLITEKVSPSSSDRPVETWREIRSLEPPGSAPTYISTEPDGYSPPSLPPRAGGDAAAGGQGEGSAGGDGRQAEGLLAHGCSLFGV